MERIILTLWSASQAHESIRKAWGAIKPVLMAGHRLTLEIKPETRSMAQNRRLWSMLADISEQVTWHGEKLTSEEWKHFFTASLKKQKIVQGMDGGLVVLGCSTSKMTKAEMMDLQTIMEMFGANHGVTFKDDN
jgi:NinB protein